MTRAVEDFPADEGILFDDRFFTGFFALVAVLMVAGLALFAWLLVRNLRLLRRGGTARPGGRPAAPLEERLRELDDLHRRGVISAAEHATARQRTLASP